MTLYYGATQDLEKIITTHLFIICTNNSGTTFLRNALATSHRTWNLIREGQHMFGFAGPSSIGEKAHKRWASEPRWIDTFTDPGNYDWQAIKNAWYFQAYSLGADASVFVEKSPPFLLIVDQVVRQFKNARFLFMVRDPYAVVEGTRRKSPTAWRDSVPPAEVLTLAATHVINCLRQQKKNLETWGEYGVFFTYEEMCAAPEKIAATIKNLVPALDDLNLNQRVEVREYNEELRNMNDQQISRLTSEDLEQINAVFSPHADVLDFFGYRMIS